LLNPSGAAEEVEVLGAVPAPSLPEWRDAGPPAIQVPASGEEEAAAGTQATVTELSVS